jgi:hypothetical protein
MQMCQQASMKYDASTGFDVVVMWLVHPMPTSRTPLDELHSNAGVGQSALKRKFKVTALQI